MTLGNILLVVQCIVNYVQLGNSLVQVQVVARIVRVANILLEEVPTCVLIALQEALRVEQEIYIVPYVRRAHTLALVQLLAYLVVQEHTQMKVLLHVRHVLPVGHLLMPLHLALHALLVSMLVILDLPHVLNVQQVNTQTLGQASVRIVQ